MEKLLLVLVVILAVVGIAQIAKVYQVSSELQKRREEDISPTSNKVNANLWLLFMIAFFGFFIWQFAAYGDMLLPVAASEHGMEVDQLFNVNWIILIAVFFIVNFLLFFFSWKYVHNKNRKAYYFAHDNKLELIWTIIPTIALAFLIIYGLKVWNDVTDEPSADAVQVQLYAKQFDWTARYAGPDGVMGESNYLLITSQNPLGLITDETIEARVIELKEGISKTESKLANEILPDDQVEELEDRIGAYKRQIAKILNFKQSNKDFSTAYDDIIVKGEFHLPIRRDVSFNINSRDVIHSAYMPHFRAQMNAVPGMTTKFAFKPTITTDSMRTVMDDAEFNYILLCNKVCGSAHYNMQMNIVVESEKDFAKWLSEQKPFVEPESMKAKKESEEDKVVEDGPLAEKN
ncbi:cytochrome c oxidase subunit II [Cryomorphaceae bacterium 1068]|nr:cytochrome c oxidase subunit II [Cryomorphaceae bacterium 1068]